METTIAILIPCFNEALSIVKVITDFKQQLPQASIYVYDNGSSDNSMTLAKTAGAFVRLVPTRGKGNVVRQMFADIDADIYVMVDGDGTYDASLVKNAISLLQDNVLDMVVCVRKPHDENSFPPGHTLGNKVFTKTVNFLFGFRFTDIFSGYRVFSRRFVKSFPSVSHGFEVEAEMTIHALQLGVPTTEIETKYIERPSGSVSKLKTMRDGLRILRTILLLFLYIRPMVLLGTAALLLMVTSIFLAAPIIIHFIHTGVVPRIPTAILAASLGILASIAIACGMVLDSVSRSRLELKRFWYLMLKAVQT